MKTKQHHQSITIQVNDSVLSDKDAAAALSREFSRNFSHSLPNQQSDISKQPIDNEATLTFVCTESAIVEAIGLYPSTKSSSDGISFQLLKTVARQILFLLNVIFQHSLYESVFLLVWKQAVIIPLYKARSEHSDPSSYRPIS
jgi:hypothetical protein